MGKRRAEQARENDVKAVAQGSANAAADKNDDEAHRSDLLCLRAWKNRPAADRFLPPCCTVGVISPFRAVLGGPHPHRGETTGGAMQGQPGSGRHSGPSRLVSAAL